MGMGVSTEAVSRGDATSGDSERAPGATNMLLCYGESKAKRELRESDRAAYLHGVLADVRACSGDNRCQHWPSCLVHLTDFTRAVHSCMTDWSDYRRDPVIVVNQLGAIEALTADPMIANTFYAEPPDADGKPNAERRPLPAHLCNHARFLAQSILGNLGLSASSDKSADP